LTACQTGTYNYYAHANKADLGAQTNSTAEMEFQESNYEKFKYNLSQTRMAGHTDKDNRSLIKNLIEAAKKSIPRGAVKDHKVFWTIKLEKLRQTRNKCRNTVEQQSTEEANKELEEAQKALTEAIEEAKQERLKEYLHGLDYRADAVKAHRFLSRSAANGPRQTQEMHRSNSKERRHQRQSKMQNSSAST
jgi:hypothetical protein